MSKIDKDFKIFLGVVFCVSCMCLCGGFLKCLQQKKVNGHPIECIDGITYFVGSTITPQVDQNNKPVLCNF